ncbi:hypothetical protein I7I53_06098 [Histoplasma capsulatum var. duboisii H88]|uniref:Uncharacterized protein n=1 Tax=Ajellomyces capsulatus (strain H88) TaxID=544711 RepID=A0A8A1LB53_AJEC8|nr:hypothetical protein I7I53_06098 [Histoplasma capsulatum var. duboisii H88]
MAGCRLPVAGCASPRPVMLEAKRTFLSMMFFLMKQIPASNRDERFPIFALLTCNTGRRRSYGGVHEKQRRSGVLEQMGMIFSRCYLIFLTFPLCTVHPALCII